MRRIVGKARAGGSGRKSMATGHFSNPKERPRARQRHMTRRSVCCCNHVSPSSNVRDKRRARAWYAPTDRPTDRPSDRLTICPSVHSSLHHRRLAERAEGGQGTVAGPGVPWERAGMPAGLGRLAVRRAAMLSAQPCGSKLSRSLSLEAGLPSTRNWGSVGSWKLCARERRAGGTRGRCETVRWWPPLEGTARTTRQPGRRCQDGADANTCVGKVRGGLRPTVLPTQRWALVGARTRGHSGRATNRPLPGRPPAPHTCGMECRGRLRTRRDCPPPPPSPSSCRSPRASAVSRGRRCPGHSVRSERSTSTTRRPAVSAPPRPRAVGPVASTRPARRSGPRSAGGRRRGGGGVRCGCGTRSRRCASSAPPAERTRGPLRGTSSPPTPAKHTAGCAPPAVRAEAALREAQAASTRVGAAAAGDE